MIDEREVRFCLNCHIYYRPDLVMKDVNINLCQECFKTLLLSQNIKKLA
jgi:hypothetical protein